MNKTPCCRTSTGKLMSTDDLRKAFERYRAEYEAGQRPWGVQRPEDVARAREELERAENFVIRDSNGNEVAEDSLFETRKIIKRALAILALPHTGQPQEGLDREVLRATIAAFFAHHTNIVVLVETIDELTDAILAPRHTLPINLNPLTPSHS